MKKWRYSGVIILVMTFCFLCPASMQSGAMEKDQEDTESIIQRYEALDEINQIRTATGVDAFNMDAALNDMAESHCRYMSEEKTVSFEEVYGNAYYTGAYPLDRSTYFDYDKNYVIEYNQQRMASFEKCLEWCIQDPYQRITLLSPEYTDIGFGREDGYYCMEIGGNGSDEESVIMYPYAGQQGVGNLTIAELSRIPDSIGMNESQTIGIPVTLQYYNAGLDALSFKNVRVELKDTRKQTVMDVAVVTPQDEKSGRNTLILFPKERYQANTGYTVSVRFDVWYKDAMLKSVEEKWTFTSAGMADIGEVNRKNAILSLAAALKIPKENIEKPDKILQYNDVSQKDEEFNLLYKLRKDQILDPNDRYFYSEEYTTREQAVWWLIQMIRGYAPQIMERIEIDYRDTFEDINQCSDKTRDAVQMAYQMGLIEDQGRGIFNPQALITQAEMDAIVEKVDKVIHIQWDDKEQENSEETNAEM